MTLSNDKYRYRCDIACKRYQLGLMSLVTLSLLSLVSSQSMMPTVAPSSPRSTTAPTTMLQPHLTTSTPTSLWPSLSPVASPQPTFSPDPNATEAGVQSNDKFASSILIQRFQIENEREMNETEQTWFCDNMEGYTDDFGGNVRVNTTCRILSQSLQNIRRNRQLRQGQHSRHLQVGFFNQVQYSMTYSSIITNVTMYPKLFRDYVNEDLVRLSTDLQSAGLAVTSSFLAFNVIQAPTMAPTPVFTRDPTIDIPDETATPTLDTSPTAAPQAAPKRGAVIAVSILAFAFVTVLTALFLFYRWRVQINKRRFQEQSAAVGRTSGSMSSTTRHIVHVEAGQPPCDEDDKNETVQPGTVGRLSPTVMLVSSGSFDKDEDKSNLSNESKTDKQPSGQGKQATEGIMGRALAEIIMPVADDDSETNGTSELRWGGSDDSIEIEATALYEVTEWLRQNEKATMEQRVAFMQGILDEMVASVRHGVVDAECGARAIHECAALLGLKVANDIPENTLLVTDIPQGAKQDDLISTFGEFGEIQGVAVVPKGHGFGLVRFKSITSAKNAVSKLNMSKDTSGVV